MNLLASAGLLGLLVAASVLAITNSWRLRLTALAAQYVCVAALFTQIVIWQVALGRLVVGAGVVGILLLTSREITGVYPWARRAPPSDAPAAAPRAVLSTLWRSQYSADFPFRVVAVALALVVAGSLAGQPIALLPQLSPGLEMAGFLLCGLGLFSLGLSEEPMRAGFSLLTLLSGFELLYIVVEPSLAIVALLAGVDFAVTLAVSYLALLSSKAKKETPA
jgi:hypothetical protein